MNLVLSSSKIFNDSAVEDLIGQKALGFKTLSACKSWIPPFVVVSNELFSRYLESGDIDFNVILQNYMRDNLGEIHKVTSKYDDVIVRSSAQFENLQNRGQFESKVCSNDIQCIANTILELYQSWVAQGFSNNKLALIIQPKISSLALGHLSNERRISERDRDWLVEYEYIEDGEVEDNQRFKIFKNRYELSKLSFPNALLAHRFVDIKHALHSPAEFITLQDLKRFHFEWVWDGRQVWILQVDEDIDIEGKDPNSFVKTLDSIFNDSSSEEEMKFLLLSPIRDSLNQNFKKTLHQRKFYEAGLHTTALWEINLSFCTLENLLSLKEDLHLLASNGPVVARTDLNSKRHNQSARQNLPRSDCLFSAEEVCDFIEDCKKIFYERKIIFEDVKMIFHRFIPSLSSAFVYAEPKNSVVRVDSIWGLPDGLQFYSHDSYEVNVRLGKITKEKKRYKGFMLGSSTNGKWDSANISKPWDWRSSISPTSCLSIAKDSLQLARYLNSPVKVMWFINTPQNSGHPTNVPWYYELNDVGNFKKLNSFSVHNKSNKIIRTVADVKSIESLMDSGERVKGLILYPNEEIIRNNDFIDKVAKLSRKSHTPVIFMGSILQHAFYQLSSAGVEVSCVEPFAPTKETFSYNKLVRDKIPEFIDQDGERAQITEVSGERKIELLEQKLLEEATEVAGAESRMERIEELADLLEVIQSIMHSDDIDLKTVLKEKKRKRDKNGGFELGIYLVETETRATIASENQYVTVRIAKNKSSSMVPPQLQLDLHDPNKKN